MNKNKATAIVLTLCLSIGLTAPSVQAKVDDGKIDLYQAFSNKADQMKTGVGSRIYKWSMHLPDDGIVFKSDRANFFNMATASYKSGVQLQVEKNKDELSLEELLYKMQNATTRDLYRVEQEKELVINIAKDSSGEEYIRIIKSNPFIDYLLVDEAAQQLGEYVENRIYIKNNYIYNLTITMKGDFYREHKEMFDKLTSSFKLSFDEKNAFIKELSDSVSTTREYKNTSYGWKMIMSPYWRVEGIPNARTQKFTPVYSDEELEQVEKKVKNDEKEFKVPEGVSVSLISSAGKDETASKWAAEEIQVLKDKYNSEVYEILRNETKTQANINVHHVVIRYKTVTKNQYIVHQLYVVGNGYKYLVTATMKEEQYNDAKKKNAFESMINSFSLDKEGISEYLGEIITAKSLINLNDSKEVKMKKYDFGTKLTRSFNISRNGYNFNDSYSGVDLYADPNYRGDISNNECLSALEPTSNIRVDMYSGLDTKEMSETIKNRIEIYLKDDEIHMGLANIKIQSGEYKGAKLYYIEKEYDLNAIKKFVKEDETKIYDLESLKNQYEYIIKTGKDIYTESITLPVSNMTSNNKAKVNSIWENTTISKINYSKASIQWKQHNLSEFDKEKNK
ncbi:hypothetical protein LGL55_08730 [Clostridium tagluense]|uniref:hypothetical protein n=1 Tax=Clostridium tagluense TaxID=360422 RepID=UPI001CF32E0C|nr:hypothetical protein [Clostridium tagluense]MCB2311337.1 hypothetical protein [Clostridium tagluense]MCB2316021.1 hypothetical protein [Clostridium tagluense]MCB2320913.1 hypothetical protein [Clostridium tagluense]MCB2325890.1 hypothetical protein [Clostridium tagluense]MCB2330653.1 hypothetical protein [Clostridium tagluense]